MTVAALIVLAVLVPFVVIDAIARPNIRRLAVRNITRRPGEAALVVGGSLLAAALITASFIIGNSFGASIRDLAADRWGPTDELVGVADPDELAAVAAKIEQLPPDQVDGVLAVTYLDVAAGTAGESTRIEPELRLVEVDLAEAAAYGGDSELAAAPAAPGRPSVVINQQVADRLGVEPGDDIDVFVDGEANRFEVVSVRPPAGVTGFGDLLVEPGALTGSFDDPASVATFAVLVSNTGDVLGGAELTDEVAAAIEDRLGPGFEAFPVKQELLRDADSEAANITELFGTIGGFSVAAGILLVVNLFVMLAAERKSEMGTMRAVGIRRGHLMRSLWLEGALYGTAAAVIGAGLGIGVGAAVMSVAGDLAGDSDLVLRLSVELPSLVSGAVIGLAVSQLTVTLTSWRVTGLNIVRALRDLPEPSAIGGGRRRLIYGLLGVAAGVGLYVTAGTSPAVAMFAPVVALVSLIPLLSLIVPSRWAVLGLCGAALAWVSAVFGLLPEVMAEPEVAVFLLQGVLLVGLATVMITVLDRVWLGLATTLTRGGVAARMGLAEPLARPVRSGLLVAMYSLVVFTLTFMAVLNSVFQAQAPSFGRQAGGGYELYLDANPSSGLSAGELSDRPAVAAAAPVLRGQLSGRPEGADPDILWSWNVSGIDPSFLAADPPPLYQRWDGLATDADVWAAITAGEPYLVLDGDLDLAPGDRYVLESADGSQETFTIAGTTEQNWLVGAGLIMASDQAADLFGDARPPTRYYVDLEAGADAEALASELTDSGAEQGIDATTFLAAAKAETDEQETIINLLEGYLALGLLIGIAGLGVVLARAVRERQRQFGIMRALGIAAPVVRRTFVVEAAFVASQGVVLGVGLGLLSSWQVLTRSEAFERDLSFNVPFVPLLVLSIGCLLASLATAAVPAIRAGRVTPAVALRMTT